ncbi:hypothetical protein GCM10008098_06810 [Rhodanobacter panaciterrae]|uniref:DUF4426 domain-containing protein n=1 Tax=Rhodanobacter panaciterrae TaxID=490572 RepID=A0ABQ2ZKE6_9GAMM|nr:hypothetical protein [Rhodanobacter panaciterrae]GGY17725.1 hypothetical protein GCM10008098_06810 [Rhodanobacter panaciterrae]
MRHLISVTTLVLGLACVGGVSAAQDQTQATNMRNVTVNAVPQYETYVANLDAGFALHALVGHTRRQFVQAERTAERSESLRKQGMATQPLVAVAVDDSSGPGVARQFQLLDADNETVAIVNVYCKRAVPSGGPHCRLDPLPNGTGRGSQSMAATQAKYLQVAEVDLRD